MEDNHEFEWRWNSPKVMNNILENIGGTPLVRLNRIGPNDGLKCRLLAKCEFFNAAGSVKDRIGLRMIEDAEKSGRIKPGDTLIEPTSGNTGIGLALAAAIKGYRMVITLPEKMSQEKVSVLKALGASIVRTPTEAAFDSPESHISVAARLCARLPNSHILDQYKNQSNPLAHYEGTAEEILMQTEGKVDMVVVGAGTGGTITGIAKKLKEKLPNVIVVGVDPIGSILAQPEQLNKSIKEYQVEGIGYDFVPQVLERQYVDRWIKSTDKSSFLMSRRLILEEGLLCGGSAGSAVTAAIKAAMCLKKGQTCVVILADSVRNYMSKFLSEDWMVNQGFIDKPIRRKPITFSSWWSTKKVSNLELSTPIIIQTNSTCEEAMQMMHTLGFDQLPVVSPEDEIVGVVTEKSLTSKIIGGYACLSDSLSNVLTSKFSQVYTNTSLQEVSGILESNAFALVLKPQPSSKPNFDVDVSLLVGLITRIDLLVFISAGSSTQ